MAYPTSLSTLHPASQDSHTAPLSYQPPRLMALLCIKHIVRVHALVAVSQVVLWLLLETKMCSILVRPEGCLNKSHGHADCADTASSLTSHGPCLALFASDPARLAPIHRLLGLSCRDLYVSLDRNDFIDSPKLSAALHRSSETCALSNIPLI